MNKLAVDPEPTPIHASLIAYLIASLATACFCPSCFCPSCAVFIVGPPPLRPQWPMRPLRCPHRGSNSHLGTALRRSFLSRRRQICADAFEQLGCEPDRLG